MESRFQAVFGSGKQELEPARPMLRSRGMGFRLPRRDLLAAGLILVGCYSPTLPLPPPSKPEVSALSEPGQYRFTGKVEPGAEVVALNRRSNLMFGQLTGGDGRYDFIVLGAPDDRIQFWYVVGKDSSPSITVLLPFDEGQGG